MTLYLTDRTQPDEVWRAKEAGIVAFKLYPAGDFFLSLLLCALLHDTHHAAFAPLSWHLPFSGWRTRMQMHGLQGDLRLVWSDAGCPDTDTHMNVYTHVSLRHHTCVTVGRMGSPSHMRTVYTDPAASPRSFCNLFS